MNNTAATFTIVAFGDSITLAARQAEDRRWPVLLQAGLVRKFPRRHWQVINAGVGGNTSREGLARIESDVLAKNPDIVLVEFGGNDATPDEKRHVTLDEYRRNLEAIKSRITAAAAVRQIVMLTFPPIVDAWHARDWHEAFKAAGGQDAYVEQYRKITRDFATGNHLPLADIDQALRQYLQRNAAAEVILPDGVHLTDAGNRVVAETVLDCLSAEI